MVRLRPRTVDQVCLQRTKLHRIDLRGQKPGMCMINDTLYRTAGGKKGTVVSTRTRT